MCQVNEEDDEAFEALKSATNKWVKIRFYSCLESESFLEQQLVENV
jgi:hypothetical protein